LGEQSDEVVDSCPGTVGRGTESESSGATSTRAWRTRPRTSSRALMLRRPRRAGRRWSASTTGETTRRAARAGPARRSTANLATAGGREKHVPLSAGQLLQEEVAGEEHVHQQIEFAPELVVRASTNVKPRAG
jgi:hypothetical protein